MPLTEQQTCSLLQVTPETLKVYVAMRRLNVTRTRTIRGTVVSYDELEVETLKKQLEEEEQHLWKRYARPKASTRFAQTEPIEIDLGDDNGQTSSVATPPSLIEQLLRLLEALAPDGKPKVGIERKLVLTLAEAAAYSGLPEAKLNQAIRAGELKARKDLGRGYRIKRRDVEKYVESL